MSDRQEQTTRRVQISRRGWIAIASVAVIIVVAIAWLSVAARPSGQGASGAPAETPATDGSSLAPSPSSTGVEPTDTGGAETVQPRATQAPVPLTDDVQVEGGLVAQLVTIESVDGTVTIPGEVAGPALRVTLRVTNQGAQDFATPAVVVNLYKGQDMVPAGALLEPGGQEFPSSVAAGASGVGVYVFSVPADQRDDITVEVDLGVGTPVILFHGATG